MSKQLVRRMKVECLQLNTGTHLYNSDPTNEAHCYFTEEITNVTKFKVFMRGLKDTPYMGAIYEMMVNIPQNFPFEPPKISFVTKVYHPNISNDGAICLDILKDAWSPALSIEKVILSISSLFQEPNPDDPLNTSAANEYKNYYKSFASKAIQCAKQARIRDEHFPFMNIEDVPEVAPTSSVIKITA
jgi:ubiquitin-protein ligase